MISRAEALGRHLAACVLAFPLAALAAGPAGEFQPTQVSANPDRNAGLNAFAQIERVLLHPRGVDGKGVAPLNCATCHATQNSPVAHAPPGLDTDGQPGWHMPPAKMKMSWFGLSGSPLCRVFRDPKTNGGRTLAAIEQHLVTDHLVAWGWRPGPNRQLPPLDKVAFDDQVRTWIRNGAPCDSSEPLRKSV